MPDSYASLLYHIVFATKNREPWISQDIERRIWAYVGGIAVKHGVTPVKIGGLEDHLHVIVSIPPTLSVSKAVQLLKGASSRWIRMTYPDLEAFRWQDGYGAFTVSRSQLATTVRYVEQQRDRHRSWSFIDEYRVLLDRHGVAYEGHHLQD